MIVHRTRRQTHRARACALGLLLAVVAPALARAQQPDEPPPPRRALTLDEAIRLAAKESEQLQIARAGVSRASGQLRQARSGYFINPDDQGSWQQVYAKTLAAAVHPLRAAE